jgi:hypothetical protein
VSISIIFNSAHNSLLHFNVTLTIWFHEN